MLTASHDPSLSARIIRRTELVYRDGPSEKQDRLAFVRAASGIAWLKDELAVVQDDVNFIAILGKDGVRSVAFPRGKNRRRRFEERLGNKRDKLDLESCVALMGAMGPELYGFGSGSLRPRRVIAVLEPGAARARLFKASPLFRNIRRALGIGKTQLNIEGALLEAGVVRFFQRGNRGAGNATVDVSAEELKSWVAQKCRGEAPKVLAVARYDLGAERGVPYGFTDGAAFHDGRIVFVAAAEDTDNPIDDGGVLGTRIGVIDGSDVRFARLCDERGLPVAIKAEGIAIDRTSEAKVWLVVDPDDVDRPAELCEVELGGFTRK
jgi:hypothetical protein